MPLNPLDMFISDSDEKDSDSQQSNLSDNIYKSSSESEDGTTDLPVGSEAPMKQQSQKLHSTTKGSSEILLDKKAEKSSKRRLRKSSSSSSGSSSGPSEEPSKSEPHHVNSTKEIDLSNILFNYDAELENQLIQNLEQA